LPDPFRPLPELDERRQAPWTAFARRLFMRRVVITGLGVVSPLGNTPAKLWEALSGGVSGVRELASVPIEALPTHYGAECRDFTGAIDDFGPLEKSMQRTIKKGLKVMCREMQTGIAVAQLALADSKLPLASVDRDRVGVVYGCEYMLTLPQEFTTAIRKCLDAEGKFDFRRWGQNGLPEVEPLWLLKYLPNLPASHISIFNDLHGPNNSITLREASSNLAVAEAYLTIVRGHADAILTGATGTKVHPARSIHVVTQEEIALGDGDPTRLSRPFDLDRRGAVMGEGAAAIVLEELDYARSRGAKILGEVIGYGSTAVANPRGVADLKTAFINTLSKCLQTSGLVPDEVGHVHAHGLSTRRCDVDEAQAIAAVFASRRSPVPVVAAKSYFGNLGAASGLVELIGSVLAMQHGRLFRTLNYETPDAECPVNVVTAIDAPPGDTFININASPQGQASGVVVRRFAA
jgi:3-oxoacyl-[acyl-carrier-protein] synthase II